ncbi:hypothetical protein KVF89_22670 [Nocardioides carbamazepini]|uniref:hypothetical protein n=1 Tax=Nocardioides carbamazepini TaxID=2854259 RepID=UPI002149E84F|nr:hypothetical protein [Nocardioides carbamazepini]MCR1785362.1 hypothetical protein [Nocardioides carbamazepini]
MSAPAPALRILAAVAGGAMLVGRPRGVVHVYSGALTRSGRAVPAAARPVCGVRTRRLRVLVTPETRDRLVGHATVTPAGDLAGRNRRFCRTCVAVLPARLGGGSGALVTRDDWVAAYSDLTVVDFGLATAWARTVEETHQLSTVLSQVHGPKPARPAKYRTPAEEELVAAYDAVNVRRRHLTVAAMTDDERAAVQAVRDTEMFNRRLTERQRRKAIAVENAQERARSGGYITPRDRELLGA